MTEQLDDLQQQGVNLCCTLDMDHRIVSVTGQAGTGKTTILQQAYEALEHYGHKIALTGPTGKSVKRIYEITGIKAMTLHRLLEYPHPGERDDKGKPLRITEPKRDKRNPLEYNVVFADEAAMLNQELFRNLVDALPRGGFVRFFGDVNQLPPIEQNKRLVGQPSPFAKMLETRPSVTLTHIYRQGEGSGIVQNGNLILNGRLPRRLDDFSYKITATPVDWVYKCISEGGIDWSSLENQLICPTKKGWVGTHKLNALLQGYYQRNNVSLRLDIPRHKWAEDEEMSVTVSDKIIWTQNNYTLDDGNGVFNGETGVVVECSDFGEIVIDFGDRTVVVPPSLEVQDRRGKVVVIDPRKDMDLAYAITTHKSQGSEYKRVMYVMNSSRPYMLNRNNFYTGTTRAREYVHVVTDQKALTYSMRRPIN